jgi:hypothetical protein
MLLDDRDVLTLGMWQRETRCPAPRLRYFTAASRGRLSPSASPLSLAAVTPGANLVDAEVFGNFIARNDGLGFTLSGFGARGGLKNVFGSVFVGETPNREERNKHCENQKDCHCLILRPFVSGSCFWNYRGFQLPSWLRLLYVGYSGEGERCSGGKPNGVPERR